METAVPDDVRRNPAHVDGCGEGDVVVQETPVRGNGEIARVVQS